MTEAAMNEPSRLPRREARITTRLEVTAVRDASAFAKARRHSRLVRSLRLVLPALVVVGGAGFAVKSYVGGALSLPVGFADVSIRSDALVMEKPHVSGFQDNGQAYEVRAERAIQSAANPREVTLEGIAASIGFGNGDNAVVDAGRGLLNTIASTLQLTEGITVTTTSGVEARLEHADVDLESGTMHSERPVEVRSAEGTIRGNEIEISEGGKRIVMRRGVSMTLNASRAPADPTGEAHAFSGD